MKYLVTFIWALMLTQMINFVINSLGGGGSYSFWTGILLAVLLTAAIIALDFLIKPQDNSQQDPQIDN
ncbi:YjzD family protein [Salinicoccus albus]|uniref:YjzD family protein n=1 Tax=Salinicoccus albus TaxID=418756 RepID=UPI000368ED9C|nr:YjzD family protein [Salinicoccus albus]